MALKSSREGLRKELVDYLGNIIVDDNLRNEIVKAVGDKFVTPEVLNENVNNLTMQITTESGERIEADDTLQNNITAEATAREGADTTLQNNITAEATAREGADTTLQNNINAEVTARQEAISNLEVLIGTGGKFYGIDTSVCLASSTTLKTYTATQDCFIIFVIGSNLYVKLNNIQIIVGQSYNPSYNFVCVPLKANDVISFESELGSYNVYGIKE